MLGGITRAVVCGDRAAWWEVTARSVRSLGFLFKAWVAGAMWTRGAHICTAPCCLFDGLHGVVVGAFHLRGLW